MTQTEATTSPQDRTGTPASVLYARARWLISLRWFYVAGLVLLGAVGCIVEYEETNRGYFDYHLAWGLLQQVAVSALAYNAALFVIAHVSNRRGHDRWLFASLRIQRGIRQHQTQADGDEDNRQ